jgi:hypothetical protein
VLEHLEEPGQREYRGQHRGGEPHRDAEPVRMEGDHHDEREGGGERGGAALREHGQLDREGGGRGQRRSPAPIELPGGGQPQHRPERDQEEGGLRIAVAQGVAQRGVGLEEVLRSVARPEDDQGGEPHEGAGAGERGQREVQPGAEQQAQPEPEREEDRVADRALSVGDRGVGGRRPESRDQRPDRKRKQRDQGDPGPALEPRRPRREEQHHAQQGQQDDRPGQEDDAEIGAALPSPPSEHAGNHHQR